MATKTEKKRKPVRKTKKRYPMVEFTYDEVYGDFMFRMPDLTSMPLKVQIAGRENDLGPLVDECRIAGVDEGSIEGLVELDGDEFPDFMKAWSKAGPVSTGKSGS